MKRTTPPRSSSSDEGGPPLPSGSRPKRRKRADSKGEDEAMGRPTRPGLDRRRVDNAENGFITLHEEFAELERTDFHFPNFRAFVDELNRTCQAKWKTRQVPYKRVSALLVRWEEDDLGVVKEIEMLHRIFHDTYHFDVENFTIPSGKRGYLGLIERIKSLLDIYDAEDNLFILYYAGHARQDGQSQPMWISKREGGSSFQSTAFLHLFVEMDADALLLFDSCQAVPQAFDSTGKGIVSAITATGFEHGTVGIAPEVGSHSFTNALIQVLGVLSIPRQSDYPPPTDVLLHSLLVTELKTYNLSLDTYADGSFKKDLNGHHRAVPFRRRTPIYHWLSRNKLHRQIFLSPLKKPQDAGMTLPLLPPPMAQQPLLDIVVPEVLVAIRLAPDSLDELDIEAWRTWILSSPGNATGVSLEGHAVKIEGLYRSFSSLLILRMPVDTWTSLPRSKAMTFIGYVRGGNEANVVYGRVADGMAVTSNMPDGATLSEADTGLKSHDLTPVPPFSLACPFYKLNPAKYSVQQPIRDKNDTNYRSCAGPGFKSIQRLKEHLKRKHMPVQCNRCYRLFTGSDTHGQLIEHYRAAEPCEIGDSILVEGISEAQWAQLEKQNRKKNQELHKVDKWFEIWRVLFPDKEPPSTPWYAYACPSEPSISKDSFTRIFQEILHHKIRHGDISLSVTEQGAAIEQLTRLAASAYDVHLNLHNTPSRGGRSDSSSYIGSSNQSTSLTGGPSTHYSSSTGLTSVSWSLGAASVATEPTATSMRPPEPQKPPPAPLFPFSYQLPPPPPAGYLLFENEDGDL